MEIMNDQKGIKSELRAEIPERKRLNSVGYDDRSITSSPAVGIPRSQLAPAELEALRPVIQQLYINEGQTFRELQKQLCTQYNYNPSERQFARLRKKWGIKKNTRKDDRERLLKALETSGISEEGSIGAVSLNVEKVNRWRKELKAKNAADRGYASSSSAVPRSGQLARVLKTHSRLTRQPVIKAFHVTETLLYSIDAYVAGMYDQGHWAPMSDRSLQPASSDTQDSEDDAYTVLDRFYSGCVTACELMEEKKFVEARKILSAACALLRSIIASGHRETLNYFVSIFFELTQGRFASLVGVLDLLRNFLGNMAMLVLPERHPFRAICCAVGRMDVSELNKAIILSLKTLIDVSEKKEGRYSPSAFRSQLSYVSLLHANRPVEEEIALRQLLSEVRGRSLDGTFNALKFLLINLQGQNRIEECEALGVEYLALAQTHAGDGATDVDIALGLQMQAKSQYRLGKAALAEANQRKQVGIMIATNNLNWAIRGLGILEGWLRDWGRANEADELVEEIERLIEQDTAGKENIY